MTVFLFQIVVYAIASLKMPKNNTFKNLENLENSEFFENTSLDDDDDDNDKRKRKICYIPP